MNGVCSKKKKGDKLFLAKRHAETIQIVRNAGIDKRSMKPLGSRTRILQKILQKAQELLAPSAFLLM